MERNHDKVNVSMLHYFVFLASRVGQWPVKVYTDFHDRYVFT